MTLKDEIIIGLGFKVRKVFEKINENKFNTITEIHLRADKPIIIKLKENEFFIDSQGNFLLQSKNAFFATSSDIRNTVEVLSNYSPYAFKEEMKNGFITIEGGHRVGIVGKTIINKNNIEMIKDISSINIRISHQIKGCSDCLIPYISLDGNILNTIIISQPGFGKTTLLRDIIRQVSNGKKPYFSGKNVGVADERGEIGGTFLGKIKNDVGIRTDILDCCPKALGMIMLLRSMSPQVIAVDEIGKNEDFEALYDILSAGVSVLCTIHGKDIYDIEKKHNMKEILEKKIFKRFIVLSDKNIGQAINIYDENLNSIV